MNILNDETTEYEAIQKVSIICSKGTLDMAYPGLVLANAALMSGIEANLFFTFWGMDMITKDKEDNLKVATVGNPSMGMPTMMGGLPGMSAIATHMMKKELEKLDIPPVSEFIEMIHDAGGKLYACRMAMDMFKLEESDLDENVEEVIGAMEFFEVAAGGPLIFI
jgi:peroxiredoxin family protein